MKTECLHRHLVSLLDFIDHLKLVAETRPHLLVATPSHPHIPDVLPFNPLEMRAENRANMLPNTCGALRFSKIARLDLQTGPLMRKRFVFERLLPKQLYAILHSPRSGLLRPNKQE